MHVSGPVLFVPHSDSVPFRLHFVSDSVPTIVSTKETEGICCSKPFIYGLLQVIVISSHIAPHHHEGYGIHFVLQSHCIRAFTPL